MGIYLVAIRMIIHWFSVETCVVSYSSRPKVVLVLFGFGFFLKYLVSGFVGLCICSSSSFLSYWMFLCISETIHALLLGRPNAMTGLMKMI